MQELFFQHQLQFLRPKKFLVLASDSINDDGLAEDMQQEVVSSAKWGEILKQPERTFERVTKALAMYFLRVRRRL